MAISKIASVSPSRQPVAPSRSKPSLEQLYAIHGQPWPENITRHLVAAEADDRAGMTELFQKIDRGAS